ncbi:hypothetical protein DQ04_20951000, partial [Trypanosoma grayi]|uniref:hypothetical protein n=1 Tax=Trypanosoma grayi TaxID=71804 RepID=UPI0004F47FA5
VTSGGQRIERVPVGYHLVPHSSGGVTSQPVGYRIRVGGGGGSPRHPLLLDEHGGVARKVSEVPDAYFTSQWARSGGNDSLKRRSVSDDGCPSWLSQPTELRGAPYSAVDAAWRPLLSPLLTEVDLRLRRQRLGALSDIWAASPAAMDRVLALAGFATAQRETILWEMQRMLRFSA